MYIIDCELCNVTGLIQGQTHICLDGRPVEWEKTVERNIGYRMERRVSWLESEVQELWRRLDESG